MTAFSHLDEEGKPVMVDVGAKEITKRSATARSVVLLPENARSPFANGDIQTKKGSVFQTAILAGIMAAKKTGELIPLCHPLGLDACQINIELNDLNEAVIRCTTAIE